MRGSGDSNKIEQKSDQMKTSMWQEASLADKDYARLHQEFASDCLTHWLNRFHVDFPSALWTGDPAVSVTHIHASRDEVFRPGGGCSSYVNILLHNGQPG